MLGGDEDGEKGNGADKGRLRVCRREIDNDMRKKFFSM